jgi:pyruvate kinase
VRRAKIVCTLGPATDDRTTIARLADAGMSIARLNASHGSPADRRRTIERVQAVDAARPEPVATMLDLAGPEIRTSDPDAEVTLETDSEVTFEVGERVSPSVVGLSTSIAGVSTGDRILLDDGRIEATVRSLDGERVVAHIDDGGALSGRTGVNIPGVDLGLPPVTGQDEADLDVAAETEADFVAASFVRSAEDVLAVNAELEARDADIPVIAKIERADAVSNVADIIETAYSVMIARGDLGVECPLEDVPMIQKRIIRQCTEAGVPVITATEMLDSMVSERRPTRAEASDVANAVLDGTDAVMLSGETAIGEHPVRVVETMDRIVRDVEGSEEYAEVREGRVPPAGDARTDALARSARFLARDVGADAIVAASESGYTARKAAKYRPLIPIVAASPSAAVRRQLALSWGIIPRDVARLNAEADAGTLIQQAVQSALETDVADSGDTVVVLSGMMTHMEGIDTANMLKVHVASETLASGRSIVSGRVTGPLVRVGDGTLDDLPEGAVLALPADYDQEFEGDVSRLGGIIDGHHGMTGYAAIVARELGIPMICDAAVEDVAAVDQPVTLDAERGVVYAGPVHGDR